MKKKWILYVLVIGIVYYLGILTNVNDFIRIYWKARVGLSNFTVNHPELSARIIPNFDPLFKNDYLSINEKPLSDNDAELSFFVIGHVYGVENPDAFHPPIDLITNVQKINEMEPDFLIMLGDIVTKPNNKEFMDLENYLLQPFSMPIFNVVGNHDVLDRNAYQNRYGETVYSFIYKDYLFLFLDTNIEFCSLSDDQYDFVISEIEKYQNLEENKGITILIHNVLFLDETKPWIDDIWETNWDCLKNTDFTEFVSSTLPSISDDIPVYIFAGDVGKFDSRLSPYYEKVPDSDIYMVATGLGSSDEDSILYVYEENGALYIEPFALDGREMLPIENYDYTYWLK